jgi:hypothetical protein
MANYQFIYDALVNKGRYNDGDVILETTCGGISEMYHGTKRVAVVDHHKKTATIENCSGILEIERFCQDYGYKYIK